MWVLVVDDSTLYRQALALALATDPRIAGVLEAAHAEAARVATGAATPDVLLLGLGTGEDLAALRALTGEVPGIPVIVVLRRPDDVDVLVCAEAGVTGFVHRDDSFADLVGLLVGAARGESGCSPRMAQTLLRTVTALVADRADRVVPAGLTPREREVLELLEEGLSNKQIARRLCIELRTVKNHVHHVLEKCRVSGRHEAAARYRAARLSGAWQDEVPAGPGTRGTRGTGPSGYPR